LAMAGQGGKLPASFQIPQPHPTVTVATG
jgi:hypothetical protein